MSDFNQAWWDERAALHLDTPLYRKHVAAIESGGVSLCDLEREALGDVRGLRLLHLQCHIGTDTLSWARLGAEVTGVDFSQPALAVARELSHRLELPGTFVHSRVDGEDLPVEKGSFDWVFTSYGTISWLEDLRPWARNIAAALRPGGRFFFVDGHPYALALDDETETGPLAFRYPYFPNSEALIFDEPGSYADRNLQTSHNRTEEWQHPVEQILEALIEAGLTLEHLGEHQGLPYPMLATCEEGEDGLFRLPPEQRDSVPMALSLRFRR